MVTTTFDGVTIRGRVAHTLSGDWQSPAAIVRTQSGVETTCGRIVRTQSGVETTCGRIVRTMSGARDNPRPIVCTWSRFQRTFVLTAGTLSGGGSILARSGCTLSGVTQPSRRRGGTSSSIAAPPTARSCPHPGPPDPPCMTSRWTGNRLERAREEARYVVARLERLAVERQAWGVVGHPPVRARGEGRQGAEGRDGMARRCAAGGAARPPGRASHGQPSEPLRPLWSLPLPALAAGLGLRRHAVAAPSCGAAGRGTV